MSGLGTSNISAVIPTNRKREAELVQVIAHLKSLGFEDIILAEGKKQMYNRYEAVAKAKHDVIYTQDDDCIVTNINELIEKYDPEKIVANIKLGHLIQYEKLYQSKVALVGWGAIFHKKLVNFNKFLDKFPEDKLLHREADRVFTWLNEKEIIPADFNIKDFPTAWQGMSIEDDHFPSMDRMVERLKTL